MKIVSLKDIKSTSSEKYKNILKKKNLIPLNWYYANKFGLELYLNSLCPAERKKYLAQKLVCKVFVNPNNTNADIFSKVLIDDFTEGCQCKVQLSIGEKKHIDFKMIDKSTSRLPIYLLYHDTLSFSNKRIEFRNQMIDDSSGVNTHQAKSSSYAKHSASTSVDLFNIRSNIYYGLYVSPNYFVNIDTACPWFVKLPTVEERFDDTYNAKLLSIVENLLDKKDEITSSSDGQYDRSYIGIESHDVDNDLRHKFETAVEEQNTQQASAQKATTIKNDVINTLNNMDDETMAKFKLLLEGLK